MLIFGRATHFFLCAGSAEGPTSLNAFDFALLEAGVGNTNLMKMSSIMPPGVKETGIVPLEPGSFVPLAYASINSSEEGRLIAAAVAAAIPEDDTLPGVIMEHSGRASAASIEEKVRKMAEDAMVKRGYRIREIRSISVEHKVEENGAAFAAVVLHRMD